MKKIISAIVLLMMVTMMMAQARMNNNNNVALLGENECIQLPSGGGDYRIVDDYPITSVQPSPNLSVSFQVMITTLPVTSKLIIGRSHLEENQGDISGRITLQFADGYADTICVELLQMIQSTGRYAGGPKRVRTSTAGTSNPTYCMAEPPATNGWMNAERIQSVMKKPFISSDTLSLEMDTTNYYYGAGVSFTHPITRKQGLYLQTDINLLGGKRSYNIRNLNTNTIDSSFSRTRVKVETPLLVGFKYRPISIYTGIIPSVPIYTEKYKLFEKAGESAHLDYCFGAAVQWKRLHLTAMYRGNFYQQDEIVSLNGSTYKIPFRANSISVGMGYLLQKPNKK